MNYLKNLISSSREQSPAPSDILPVSSENFSCEPNECHFKFPSSCFKLKAAAMAEPLWESTKTPDLRIIVPTGQSDWGHDALNDNQPKDSMHPLISKLGGKLGETANIKVSSNTSSEPFDLSSKRFGEYSERKVVDLLLLPWFVRIKGLDKSNAEQIFKILAAVALNAEKGKEGKTLIESINIEGVVVEMDVNSTFVLLCSHNTRDKKCGQTASYMRKEFESQLQEHGLHRDLSDDRPDGVRVLFINHVGGHKFAANVLIHKKNGEFVWFARCTPLNVKALINETIINDKIFTENVRTCKKFDAVEW